MIRCQRSCVIPRSGFACTRVTLSCRTPSLAPTPLASNRYQSAPSPLLLPSSDAPTIPRSPLRPCGSRSCVGPEADDLRMLPFCRPGQLGLVASRLLHPPSRVCTGTRARGRWPKAQAGGFAGLCTMHSHPQQSAWMLCSRRSHHETRGIHAVSRHSSE